MGDPNLDLLSVSSQENVFYVSDVPTGFAANRPVYYAKGTVPIFCLVPKDWDE